MYREYGAKYEIMIKDTTSALENLPEWETHQRGLEAFAFTIEASPLCDDRRSLTMGDLLVKVRPLADYTSISDILPPAHPKGLQVPPLICRAIEMHACH